MNILLTGASGFIGKHFLTQTASRHDYNIIAIRHKTIVNDPQLLNIKWVDASDLQQLARQKFDSVVHLATSYHRQDDNFAEAVLNNVVFPLQVFDLAAKGGCRKFISADSFYSREQYNYQHMRPYIQSKRQLRTWAFEYCNHFADMCYLNLRLEHVYGSEDGQNKFLPSLLQRMFKNEADIALTDCTQKRDLIHASDVVRALTTLIDATDLLPGFQDVECGTGQSIPLYDVVKWCSNTTQTSSHLHFGALPQRSGEIMDSYADTRILNDLGWHAQICWQDGLNMLIQHERAILKKACS